MGQAKGELLIDGEPLAVRIARELNGAGWPVTVLGRHPLPGHAFLADQESYAGPAGALRRFQPSSDLVFVAACDLAAFRGEVPEHLAERLAHFDAVIPLIGGIPQSLCALYRADSFAQLRDLETFRMRDWLKVLNPCLLEGLPFPAAWITSVNTPRELQDLLAQMGTRACRETGE